MDEIKKSEEGPKRNPLAFLHRHSLKKKYTFNESTIKNKSAKEMRESYKKKKI